MRNLIFFFLLLQFHTISSQSNYEFAPLGAEWTFNLHQFSFDYPVTCEGDMCDLAWRTLKVVEKDTIEGKVFSQLALINPRTNEETPTEIKFHQQGDSVYYLYNDTLRLLYDFSVKDGDEILIDVPNFAEISGPVSFVYENLPPIVTSIMKVYVMDSILINGEFRRRFSYISIDNLTIIENIIDGIGSTVSLCGISSLNVGEGCGGWFWCYSDENVKYPQNCCEVTPVVTSVDEAILQSIDIYPNPVSDILYIESNSLFSPSEYIIRTVTGSKVQSGSVNNNQIDIQRLNPGILFLELLDGTTNAYFKIIKE